jgi:drug/metabolite transporter (DMT)-like permease
MGNIGVILLINCFFYILSSWVPVVGIKYVQYKYNYNNFWFNIFLTISLCPIYFLFLIRRDIRQRLYKYKKKLLFPVVVGILSTVETLLLYYSFQGIPLSLYIVLRSSTIIFNIPFFYYLLKIKITKIYLVNCLLLLLCYIMFMCIYGGYSMVVYTVLLLVGCFIGSTYSNLIEYSLKQKNEGQEEGEEDIETGTRGNRDGEDEGVVRLLDVDVEVKDADVEVKDAEVGVMVEVEVKDVMTEVIGTKDTTCPSTKNTTLLDYQIVFQIAYFASSIIPTAMGLSRSDSGPIPTNAGLVIMYIAIGILSQLSIYNRLQILKSSGISNILFCGLELIRRIIILVFSFVVYMEEINTFIVVGIVLFIISGLLLLFEYVRGI